MKEIKIKLPESKDEIKLSTYLKLIEIEADDSLSSKDRVFKTIQAIFDITEEQVKQIKFSDVVSISDHFTEVLSRKEERQIVKTFEYEGVNYGMIPDLDEISLAEYVDLEESEKDPLKANLFLNVMYRPIKEIINGKHTIVDYDNSQTIDFSNLPISVLDRAKVFFYTLGTQLLSSTAMKLANMTQTSQLKKESFTKVGDGTTQSIKLQREILQDLTMFYHKIYTLFFSFSNLRMASTDLKENELTHLNELQNDRD